MNENSEGPSGPSLQPVLEAVGRGESVIAVNADKRPWYAWKRYQQSPADRAQVEAWANSRDCTGFAVVCGEVSRLVVLDFDDADGIRLCRRLGLDPHVQTPSGGFHVRFGHPGFRVKTLNSATAKALQERWHGLDIRADGGYAVEWGRNAHGEYRVLRDLAAHESLDELPGELLADLGIVQNGTPPDAATEPDPQRKVRHPGRHAHLLGVAGAMRGRGEQKQAIASELRKVNQEVCDPPKPDEEVAALAADVAHRYKPDADDARQQLTELLKLDAAGWTIDRARVVGHGSDGSADLYLRHTATGEVATVTFMKRRDFANAQKLNAELSCFGVLSALKSADALQANVLLGRISQFEATDTEDDAAVAWGVAFLRAATVIDANLDDQSERWGAFAQLERTDPWGESRAMDAALAGSCLVLRHAGGGGRLVRSSWFYGHVRRREAGAMSTTHVIERMKRVGWQRRAGRSRIKATHPTDRARPPLLFSFFVVPADWEEKWVQVAE